MAMKTKKRKPRKPAAERLRHAAAPPNKWVGRLAVMLAVITKRNRLHGKYADANRDSVTRTLEGRDPFRAIVSESAGARMVVNVSSAHVPGFCRASIQGNDKPYKNCYDLAPINGWRVSKLREMVDKALPQSDPKSLYFAAAELNGCGIRFYGDMCLVLHPLTAAADTVVLDRNSFEVLRDPVSATIAASGTAAAQHLARQEQLKSWSGSWGMDLGAMVSIRSLHAFGARDNRWTIGQVSTAVCNDEDYIEVLKRGSFGARDLQEVRVSAEEAAQDAWIGSRLGRAPTPGLESLIWRQRRRNAERALHSVGVAVRVVTTSGRTRG
jgi:hypothetical protein